MLTQDDHATRVAKDKTFVEAEDVCVCLDAFKPLLGKFDIRITKLICCRWLPLLILRVVHGSNIRRKVTRSSHRPLGKLKAVSAT